jgi:hypothetical protein
MASGGGAAPGPALAPNQGGTGPVIVFDWDCTITCKHMFKVLAGWPGYWCARRLVPTLLRACGVVRHAARASRATAAALDGCVALTLLPRAAAVPGARSEPFSEWCGQQGIPDPLKTPMRDSICERMVSSAQLSPPARPSPS